MEDKNNEKVISIEEHKNKRCLKNDLKNKLKINDSHNVYFVYRIKTCKSKHNCDKCFEEIIVKEKLENIDIYYEDEYMLNEFLKNLKCINPQK